jgi:hypothetical protein
MLQGNAYTKIGCVTDDPYLKVMGQNGEYAIQRPIDSLKNAWQSPTRKNNYNNGVAKAA